MWLPTVPCTLSHRTPLTDGCLTVLSLVPCTRLCSGSRCQAANTGLTVCCIMYSCAGGSLFKSLAPLASAKGIDWSKTHVFFVDERNVAHGSDDSNYKAAGEALLSKVRRSTTCMCAGQRHLRSALLGN